jgi:hypothetical protein
MRIVLLAAALLLAVPARGEERPEVLRASGAWRVLRSADREMPFCLMATTGQGRLFGLAKMGGVPALHVMFGGLSSRGSRGASGVEVTFENGGTWNWRLRGGRSRDDEEARSPIIPLPAEKVPEFLRDLTATPAMSVRSTAGRAAAWHVSLRGVEGLLPVFTECAKALPAGETDERVEILPYTYMREPEPSPSAPARAPARTPAPAPAPRPGRDLLPLPHPLAAAPNAALHPDGPEKLPE